MSSNQQDGTASCESPYHGGSSGAAGRATVDTSSLGKDARPKWSELLERRPNWSALRDQASGLKASLKRARMRQGATPTKDTGTRGSSS